MPFLRSMQGYTFIELLLSIAILGMVIPPVFALFTAGYLSISGSARQTQAINLCRAQVETVKASGYNLSEYTSLPEINSTLIEEDLPGFQGFRRETAVKPVLLACPKSSIPDLEMLLVEVTVYYEFQNREHSERIAFYLGCP